MKLCAVDDDLALTLSVLYDLGKFIRETTKANDTMAPPYTLRIEVVGKADGDVLNLDIDQVKLPDHPEYAGQPFTDLMSALRAFAAAHPNFKTVNVQVMPGKK